MSFRDRSRRLARGAAKPHVAVAVLITVAAAMVAAAAPDAAPGRSAPGTSDTGAAALPLHEKTVSYLGRRFPVPYSWPVIDLTIRPTACVRFDVHAVYLGHPGPAEDCPARGIGRHTGALLIEPRLAPRAGTTSPVALDRRIAGEIDVAAADLTVVASYGDDDRATVVNALTFAGLPPPSDLPGTPAPLHDSEPVEIVRGTSQVSGLGFDTCTAPSAAQMQSWATSPFDTVGIYIGGSERACAQPNLTAAWLSARAAAGWHFMPIYAGWQAAWDLLTATPPGVLGRQSADDAVAQAAGLGIGPGALLYYDMESYTTSAQGTAALAFESAWTSELHAQGYLSAIYSSASTGIADLVSHRGRITEPDVLDIAHWNGIADADPGATPAGTWQDARAHQYLGGADATYGGVKMNIDKDYLSINLPQPPGSPSPSPSAEPTASATSPSPNPSLTPSSSLTPPLTPSPSAPSAPVTPAES